MSDYIAWYSIELRLRLAPHMPAAKVESIVKESQSHLGETAERLKADLGLTESSAVLAAIDAFGNPEKVALTHLREIKTRVLGIKPMWFVVGCGLMAFLCWDFHWMSLSGPLDNYGETWQNGLAGFIGFIALLGFVAGCRAGRRSYRLPVAGLGFGLAVLLPFVVAYVAIMNVDGEESIMRPRTRGAVRTISDSLVKLDRLEAFVKRGASEYSATTPTNLSADMRDLRVAEAELGISWRSSYPAFTADGREIDRAFVTPNDWVYAPSRGGLQALQGAATFAEARKRWAEASTHSLASIGQSRHELLKMLTNIHQAENGRIFFFNGRVSAELVSTTLVFLPGLLLLDAITFAFVRRKRAWPVPGLA
jgi:hypothetical protein